MPFLQAIDISRHYRRGPQTIRALDGISLAVERGEFICLVGSSGSGKTTLLNLFAGLDTPTSGSLIVNNVPLSSLSRPELSAYRAHTVGMIFQSFNLISHYTALQNVETALFFNDTPRAERRKLAVEALGLLGLADRMSHKPADLSGGEQQRVAIARAIAKRPELLFADEPTGNLDFENADQIGTLLTDLNRNGLTVVMVTHNLELARRIAGRTIRLRYGKIESDESLSASKGGTA